jgi:hypothetical protein
MSEWITHRLPTVSDLVGVEREVWYYCTDQGFASRCHWSDIERLGEPWQPITTPAPYVKPKRWTVDFSEYDNTWIMRDNVEGWVRLLYIDRCHGDAAQRIADIYNEEKP